jgi:hypothetical protein
LGAPPPGAKLKLKKLGKAYDVSVNMLSEARTRSEDAENDRERGYPDDARLGGPDSPCYTLLTGRNRPSRFRTVP